MKNKIDRTQTGTKMLSTRMIAMVLCCVMFLTAIGSGSVLNAFALTKSAATDEPVAETVDTAVDSAEELAEQTPADVFDTEETMLGKKQDSDLAEVGASVDLAEMGDTTYYMHIGVQSAFRTSSGIAFTYDSTNSLYYASYNLVKDKEYPMVINTTSGTLGDGNKSSSTQSVTSLASSWNPDSIQFDYFAYNTNTYDGYDGFKFKTQTSQTVYFTFASGSSQLVVRSTLPSGGSEGSGSGGASGTQVSAGNLLDVLKGEKIMFYYGDEWGSGTKYLMKKDTTTQIASGSSSVYFTKCNCAIACVAPENSNVSNKSNWSGTNIGVPVGGGIYCLYDGGYHDNTGTGGVTASVSFSVSSDTVAPSDTTCDIAATASGHTGVSNSDNVSVELYYTTDNTNFYSFDPDDLSGMNLTAGTTYTIKAVIKDTNDVYVLSSSTGSLTVITPTYYDVTVKSNNARLGTGTASPATAYAGQTVTINISENMGAISTVTATDANSDSVTVSGSGTTRTFTMPSSAVTVNLTFEDYSVASDFYYNSYETNGNESSSRYAAQMTEGKLNGETFSYYHVEGRSGTDQLFTVSYKNPAHSTTVYFRTPEGRWSDKHGWNSGIQAQFYSTDQVVLKDWAWMTWDKTEGTGDKVYKISVPYGARYVQFRGTSNDGSNWPYTKYCDMSASSNDQDTFYIDTYSIDSNSQYDDIKNMNIGNQGRLVPENFYENFNGTGKYTNNWSTNGFNNHNASHTGSHSYTKPNNLGTSSGDYYILVLYSGKSYTINGVTRTAGYDPEIIWLSELPGTEDIDTSEVNVYAKDGSVVIDWNSKGSAGASDTSGTAYGYGVIAETHLYDSDGTTSIGTAHTHNSSDYESAKVVVSSDEGTDIVIKTTISSTYTSKYYLKGWCVNGKTYACGTNVEGVNAESAGTASGSDRLYTMTYTVPAGSENNSNIEITPIYYLTSSYISQNELEMVTFYVEGYNTISSKWGDTPYIYPFYGNLGNIDNSFGVYPGQPMVYANGQYSVEIPVNKNVPIYKALGSTAIKGITINNGYADHVHRNKVYKWSDHDNDADHKQTYDFDDFCKIYEECLTNAAGNNVGHPNAIIFRIQDEETVFNRSEYGGGKSGQFASGTSSITLSDIQNSGNGWELLVNRYGEAVNIFGEHSAVSSINPTTYSGDTSNAIYVVSTGYNANIAGDYGTMWKIYDSNGNLISNAGGRVGIPPSVLVLRGSSSGYDSAVDAIGYPSADHSVDGVGSYKDSIDDYEDIYKYLKTNYNDKIVYITYEKDAQDTRYNTSGTGAYRLDGRWYYTHSSDNVQATMSIQYWDDATGTWLDDDGLSGTPSYSSSTAVFTDSGASGHTSGSHLISAGESYTFTASAGTGWQFDSWQIKYSDTSYDPISTSASSSMPATASYHIVARFVKTSDGDLTITHTLNSNSTGEGTVDMAVNVYTDSTLGTKVSGFTEKTGTRVYLDSTYINNSSAANYYIKVELKTTPMYDGKVTAFGYDSFNTSKSITATTSPATLPGSANTLTTSTFSFPVSALYNVSTQKTNTLNYTSLITDTPHYYNFVYNFTDRGGASKSYTAKGVMDLTDYKKVVSDQATHTLDNSILVAKAPFESNFLKSNTLTKGTISYAYDSANDRHTYSATSTFTQNDALPKYHVTFMLPYSYYSSSGTADGIAYKKYTVQPTGGVKVYDHSTATFTLAATYNTFVTTDAGLNSVGANTNVSKVADSSDINHTGNDFLTAPEELMDDDTTMYFKYWEIKKSTADGDAVARVYYPDFHYRVYSDYYVEAVYSATASDSWKFNYDEDVYDGDGTYSDKRCSILYLGDSRNQWNNGSGASSSDSSVAADKIYNDFIFNYVCDGKELQGSADVEVGMILERATYIDTSDSNKQKWLTGSTTVNDMSYYRAEYGGETAKSTESARKTAISTALTNNTTLPSGTVKVTWDTDELNNKNFTEQSYSVYSAYGQTVANDTITFATDNTIDNFVYRAYAYMKADDDTYVLSDPVYFCMRYTSNLGYTE